VTTAIIPARLSSYRLNKKLLLQETGKPLIAHTIEAADKCESISSILVATEDEPIKSVVDSIKTKNKPLTCILTKNFRNGFDRVKHVCCKLDNVIKGCVVYWQADEPSVNSRHIRDMLNITRNMSDSRICTLATTNVSDSQFTDPNNVKVVVQNPNDLVSNAMYFSRLPIPFGATRSKVDRLIHAGVFVIDSSILTNLPSNSSSYSGCEDIEQLSWLQERVKIKVLRTDSPVGGIDTLADYQNFVKMIQKNK
jgi:3-deoxy-manno-octulosonate cytidylyltransferase (CMP-KDO synthetase)